MNRALTALLLVLLAACHNASDSQRGPSRPQTTAPTSLFAPLPLLPAGLRWVEPASLDHDSQSVRGGLCPAGFCNTQGRIDVVYLRPDRRVSTSGRSQMIVLDGLLEGGQRVASDLARIRQAEAEAWHDDAAAWESLVAMPLPRWLEWTFDHPSQRRDVRVLGEALSAAPWRILVGNPDIAFQLPDLELWEFHLPRDSWFRDFEARELRMLDCPDVTPVEPQVIVREVSVNQPCPKRQPCPPCQTAARNEAQVDNEETEPPPTKLPGNEPPADASETPQTDESDTEQALAESTDSHDLWQRVGETLTVRGSVLSLTPTRNGQHLNSVLETEWGPLRVFFRNPILEAGSHRQVLDDALASGQEVVVVGVVDPFRGQMEIEAEQVSVPE